jgi:hypothetical protein
MDGLTGGQEIRRSLEFVGRVVKFEVKPDHYQNLAHCELMGLSVLETRCEITLGRPPDLLISCENSKVIPQIS